MHGNTDKLIIKRPEYPDHDESHHTRRCITAKAIGPFIGSTDLYAPPEIPHKFYPGNIDFYYYPGNN